MMVPERPGLCRPNQPPAGQVVSQHGQALTIMSAGTAL
jgi:hypothetical protein